MKAVEKEPPPNGSSSFMCQWNLGGSEGLIQGELICEQDVLMNQQRNTPKATAVITGALGLSTNAI